MTAAVQQLQNWSTGRDVSLPTVESRSAAELMPFVEMRASEIAFDPSRVDAMDTTLLMMQAAASSTLRLVKQLDREMLKEKAHGAMTEMHQGYTWGQRMSSLIGTGQGLTMPLSFWAPAVADFVVGTAAQHGRLGLHQISFFPSDAAGVGRLNKSATQMLQGVPNMVGGLSNLAQMSMAPQTQTFGQLAQTWQQAAEAASQAASMARDDERKSLEQAERISQMMAQLSAEIARTLQ